MNSYQIHKAVLFWAPRWAAAWRRIFLYVQNDRTFPILFCIDSDLGASFAVPQQSLLPTCTFLHNLTRLKFADILLFMALPAAARERSLGGDTSAALTHGSWAGAASQASYARRVFITSSAEHSLE